MGSHRNAKEPNPAEASQVLVIPPYLLHVTRMVIEPAKKSARVIHQPNERLQ